jgi:dihydrofolate synthase/folylpolyglutamate synthase
MAFDYFARKGADIAVVEVGLGGRLDSTNIIDPLVSVITNIGFDHEQFLGDTLEKIAFEKGGIIKPGRPVVISEYQEEVFHVFAALAKAVDAPVYVAEDLVKDVFESDLLGHYQLKNVKAAVQTLRLLQTMDYHISGKNIVDGLLHVSMNTGLKGRWQVLGNSPKIVCDTAHNKEGLRIAMAQLQKEQFETLHMVVGVVNDKNLDQILPILPADAVYYFCRPDIPRGLPAQELQEKAKTFGRLGKVYGSVPLAFEHARQKAGVNDFIYIGGSTFVVAEIDL